jgi:hypothetical protein
MAAPAGFGQAIDADRAAETAAVEADDVVGEGRSNHISGLAPLLASTGRWRMPSAGPGGRLLAGSELIRWTFEDARV